MGSASFAYSGGYQYFTVPTKVSSINVNIKGAGSAGRPGGLVTGKLAVTAGSKLCIIVGQAGKANSGESGGTAAWGAGGAGGKGKSGSGGYSGGGYSGIRLTSSSGSVKAIAGGAGGRSGDSGLGGRGGGSTGESGARGTSGTNATSNATGGTPTQGGNGGTSSSGSCFYGHNATSDAALVLAGAGGTCDNYSYGGGGGGGGWHPGGGGQASSKGYAPGGGGGGGSSYWGGLTSAVNTQGLGNTGNGSVSLSWTDPAPANLPPTPPSSVLVSGQNPTDQQVTKSTGSVGITAILNDPDASERVRLMARLSTSSTFTSPYNDTWGGYVTRGARGSVTLSGLKQNTRYWVRLYAQDDGGLYSTSYTSVNFWTNRSSVPELQTPAENARIPSISSVVFTWKFTDPDGDGEAAAGSQLRWRTTATSTGPAGAWTLIDRQTLASTTYTANPGSFRGNAFYEWTARTKDNHGLWSDWALTRSFFITSVASPPVPLSPIGGHSVDVTSPAGSTFYWRFVDPDPGDAQKKADMRWRVVGGDDDDWIYKYGELSPGAPGGKAYWLLPGDTFMAGYQYEWQVRTYDTIGLGLSGWSVSAFFWGIRTPGWAIPDTPAVESPLVAGSLGCGSYRVFVYAQGGKSVIGEIEPLSALTFKRVRDDISNCVMFTNGYGADCGAMLGSLRSWLHELVIFRDGKRVWEGPITRIGYSINGVEIEAKDVMAYLYRRVMRQGYNDSYQLLFGQQIGLSTSVDRARAIISNALAPWDPNVLPYLTSFNFAGDARQSRVIPDWSQTAWEQVDDLAATAGLDYTVIGRRIILWDTHRRIGQLPEMRDGDFSDPPIVTEYGMQLCNFMAVTNGSGVAGTAEPVGTTAANRFKPYGPIEMLASAYGESASGTADVLTSTALLALQASLSDQARRNIDDRWPTPLVVRVPDNSTLNPEVAVTFDQLVPGVWIPLRALGTPRKVSQWQKLDSVTVTSDGESLEKVAVVLSPAPNGGDDDPDDTGGTEG